MSSLVLQLQQLASEDSGSVADLLRKARLVASKLKLDEFNQFLSREMHGYNDIQHQDELPDYRILNGDIRAHNPVNGMLIPVRFGPELTETFSKTPVAQSIGDLENLVRDDPSKSLQFPYSEQQVAKLRGLLDPSVQNWLIPFRKVEASQVFSILDRVRSIVLDWSLELEANEILGEGLTFSADERKRAGNSTFHIHNFQGIIGDINKSKVKQQFNQEIREGDIVSLKDYLQPFGFSENDLNELQQAIESDPSISEQGKFGTNVASWVGKTMAAIAGGGYDITVGAAGEILATAINAYYGV